MTAPTGIRPGIPANTPPDILLFRHAATDMGDGPRRYVGRTEVPLSHEGRAQAAAWRRRLAALDVVGAYASPLERARETARLMLGQGDAPDSPVVPAVGGGCAAGCGESPRAWGTPDSANAPDTSGASATSGASGTASMPVTILDDLAEMDLGEWEGLVQMQVRETRPDAYARRGREPWTFRPPRGECCADVAARGLRALDSMWRDWAGEGACARARGLTAGQLSPSGSCGGHGPFIVAVSHAGLIRSLLCALGHMGREQLFTLPVRHLHCVRLCRNAPDGGSSTGGTVGAGATGATGPVVGTGMPWKVVSSDWQP